MELPTKEEIQQALTTHFQFLGSIVGLIERLAQENILLHQLVEGTENKALHDEVIQLRASNKDLYEIVDAIFYHEEVSDVRKCRSCGVPVIHMEHLKLDTAKAIEVKARALLQQETKQKEVEEAE